MLALLSSIVLLPAQPSSLEHVTNGHEPISVMVRYDDLDLSNDAGLTQLRRRLKRAVTVACPLENALDLARRLQTMECRERAQEQSARQLDRVIAQRSGSQTMLSRR